MAFSKKDTLWEESVTVECSKLLIEISKLDGDNLRGTSSKQLMRLAYACSMLSATLMYVVPGKRADEAHLLALNAANEIADLME